MDIISRQELNKTRTKEVLIKQQDYTMSETSYSINKSTNNDTENESAMELVVLEESESVLLT